MTNQKAINLLVKTTLSSSLVLLAACQAADHAAEKSVAPVSSATATPPVTGQGMGEEARKAYIEAYDSNGDGGVSQGELEQFRTARFKSADSDGNGLLSANEYVDEYAARLEQQIASERKA